MNSSFKDFVNTPLEEDETDEKDEDTSQIKTPEGFKREDMSGFEDLIKNYSKYSESDLIKEFTRLTAEGKKNGTLNSESLKKLSETIRPMLNKRQQNMLDTFLKYL